MTVYDVRRRRRRSSGASARRCRVDVSPPVAADSQEDRERHHRRPASGELAQRLGLRSDPDRAVAGRRARLGGGRASQTGGRGSCRRRTASERAVVRIDRPDGSAAPGELVGEAFRKREGGTPASASRDRAATPGDAAREARRGDDPQRPLGDQREVTNVRDVLRVDEASSSARRCAGRARRAWSPRESRGPAAIPGAGPRCGDQ